MKRKEKIHITSATIADLESQIREVQKQLVTLQLVRNIKPQKNVREAKTLRVKLAVLKTVLAQKRI